MICLNMIVRNEAHVIRENLDAVAPYINSWVIVDTGSNDGTQDLIRDHMARLDIPGELHERPWRNFGENRTEALALAQGHGDYIWVIDADDMIVGTPDFTELSADAYLLHYRWADDTIFWRPQLFRDGLRWRYEGLVHENPVGEPGYTSVRLEGEYHIEARSLGGRSQDPQKHVRDRDLLLAEVERNPEDARALLHLARNYFDLGDFVNARKWCARLVEMGGSTEGTYHAMLLLAESMAQLDTPWPDVQDAYLRAWEFRPTRAEPLYAIAQRHRVEARYPLGYLFAERAAKIPLPEDDALIARAAIYDWCATDEQAICASWIGKHAEAFTLCRRLLARTDIPDDDRRRIAVNRDFSVPAMLESASSYPDALVRAAAAGSGEPDVVVSLIAGPNRATTEQTLNSFLNCCTDVSRVGRFLALDAGLSTQDRSMLHECYGFLEFAGAESGVQAAPIDGRFWLHLGQGSRFFAPENLITRLISVLEAERRVFQVGINFADATDLTGACAGEQVVRRAPNAGRYVLTEVMASGPAMFDTALLSRAGSLDRTGTVQIADLGRLSTAAGLLTATLDEVLCITAR
jgi:Glycosyl transferase family 2